MIAMIHPNRRLGKVPWRIPFWLAGGILLGAVLIDTTRALWFAGWTKIRGRRTVASVLSNVGPQAESRLHPVFAKVAVPYPPREITLIALKEERRLEIWARAGPRWRFIHQYAFTASSGSLGPKLREGDRQIPEGHYQIESLNPNSAYHLSMKLDYPNDFDLKMARKDGRTRLGGDIFIHGKAASIGCIAVGDDAIEELFTLVTRVGVDRTSVIIAPRDLRLMAAPADPQRTWVTELYASLRNRMMAFRRTKGPDIE
jgi:murein L,D-transpeptidase YafK